MNTMKRVITVLLTAAVLTGTAGAAAQAAPVVEQQAAFVCNTHTSTPGSANGWRFLTSASWWRLGPLAALPSCGRYVTVVSSGWRFDGTQCGQFWVRRPLPGGGTYIVPGSVKYICGGETEVLVSRCTCPHFWVEAWPFPNTDRHGAIWPVVVVRY